MDFDRYGFLAALAVSLSLVAGAAAADPRFDLAPFSELDSAGSGFPELGGFLPPNLALVLQLGTGLRVSVTQNGNNNFARIVQR